MALSLFARPARPEPTAIPAATRQAIIDIGSNSIRLVVYDRAARIPATIFNEKVMAGLGKSLPKDGRIDQAAMARAITALTRFRMIVDRMDVGTPRTVATAAVRDALNGADFLARLQPLGLEVELLSGEQEAELAGIGVLSAIPDARGVVGDLGGGSLELIRVADGQVHERLSLPLGVLRLEALRAKARGTLDRVVARALDEAGWTHGRGEPFYLVGGSWRALARLDMHLTRYPLPIVHHYRMPAGEAAHLVRVLAHLDRKRLRDVVGLSSSRAATAADAAALLSVIVRRLGSAEIIASAYGLREGLIQASLPPELAAEDPLLSAAREEGERQGRFPAHGDALDRWLRPIFTEDGSRDARLRHAACLLSDVGWRAHPEFRAERGLDMALHGSWVGIDARGRALIARALYTSFGGNGSVPVIDQLTTPEDRAMADRWGLAMRLGQRLDGGVGHALATTRLSLTPDTLTLHVGADGAALAGESIERRLKDLAAALRRKGVVAAG